MISRVESAHQSEKFVGVVSTEDVVHAQVYILGSEGDPKEVHSFHFKQEALPFY